MNGCLPILEHTMKVTKLYKCGVEDKKALPIEVEFCMNNGNEGCNAYALSNNGMELLPTLRDARITGWHALGFKISGYCYETCAGYSRKFYCEWWVLHRS